MAVSALNPPTFTLGLCKVSCYLVLVNFVHGFFVLLCTKSVCFYIDTQKI